MLNLDKDRGAFFRQLKNLGHTLLNFLIGVNALSTATSVPVSLAGTGATTTVLEDYSSVEPNFKMMPEVDISSSNGDDTDIFNIAPRKYTQPLYTVAFLDSPKCPTKSTPPRCTSAQCTCSKGRPPGGGTGNGTTDTGGGTTNPPSPPPPPPSPPPPPPGTSRNKSC